MDAIQERMLTRSLKAGDRDAFKALFDSYAPSFLWFAASLLKDQAAAEDVVQNVFMKLWTGRKRLDENKSLKNYLLVAVRNEVFCHHRDSFSRRSEAISADMPDASPGTDASVSASQLGELVERIISTLPPRRNLIYNMSRKGHLCNADIAARLDLSVRTVEKHLELALSDIRSALPPDLSR